MSCSRKISCWKVCQMYGAVESIHVLHANLPQLRSDLEHELRRLIQRLLAAM